MANLLLGGACFGSRSARHHVRATSAMRPTSLTCNRAQQESIPVRIRVHSDHWRAKRTHSTAMRFINTVHWGYRPRITRATEAVREFKKAFICTVRRANQR